MKKTYEKPAMTLERFVAEMPFAEISCNREVTDEVVATYPAQKVICMRPGGNGTQEFLFASGNRECIHGEPDAIGYLVAGTKYNSFDAIYNAIAANSSIPAGAGSGAVTASGYSGEGPYTITQSGIFVSFGQNHFAPATGTILQMYTSSY